MTLTKPPKTDVVDGDLAVAFATALTILWAEHGRVFHEENDDILGTLVRTILAQATNRENRERAFAQLLDSFGGEWRLVDEADVENVADAIRVGGLAKQKAPRIQNVLRRVVEAFGVYSLESLAAWETNDAIAFLEALPGVGPKTAAFTLMWSINGDALAMNTDIFRVLRRLGFLNREGDKVAHRKVQQWVPEGASYSAHMVLIAHGRETCLTRTPRCEACVLSNRCERIGVSL